MTRARRLSFASLGAVLAAGVSSAALACPGAEPCHVEQGTYRLRLPQGWDGKTALPVLVFMHGYRGSADEIAGDVMLAEELDRRGMALVAPQGAAADRRGASWSFPGKAETGRDDVAFIESVVGDVAKRIPVDRKRLIASGFSVGGSMTWYLACQGHGLFAAYVPVAGAFWVPEPTDCTAGPQVLRHVHGLNDPMVPMMGRALGGPTSSVRQGEVRKGMATWRRVNGCPNEPTRHETVEGLDCDVWDGSACRSGKALMLCLHAGEHEIEARWVAAGIDWASAALPTH
ncbi:PHB depolymerase family esterase [uncultured Alsobacter sp.]|uniref:alpha/beta hydrolase family esterase n=1 Tax=uncultured Alsobacter sp. TaxID=1748258 RepID=UPI0025FC9705|nr:PHB depolymerase family esterase [uncultured Alsobacter sp.]